MTARLTQAGVEAFCAAAGLRVTQAGAEAFCAWSEPAETEPTGAGVTQAGVEAFCAAAGLRVTQAGVEAFYTAAGAVCGGGGSPATTTAHAWAS